MGMDITFCTFYFDINRENWDTYNVSNGLYLHWFKNLLSLDIKLFIATEEKFLEFVPVERQKIDPKLEKTVIQITTFDKLQSYGLYNNDLESLMESDHFKKQIVHPQVPEMSKPLYNVLMFNKVYFLKEIINENPFNTEYFSWVDAGFIRDENEVKNIEQWPDTQKLDLADDKIRFFCINDKVIENLKDPRYHLLSQIRFLKGTIFFLHKTLIDDLMGNFHKNVNHSILNGYIGSDEKIFDLCYLDNPNSFDLYKCDWRTELKLFSYDEESEE